MADAPNTLADCLATSCGPVSNPAKNGGLPVHTVSQKAEKTRLPLAVPVKLLLWPTRCMQCCGQHFSQLSSSLWLAMTWHPGSQ